MSERFYIDNKLTKVVYRFYIEVIDETPVNSAKSAPSLDEKVNNGPNELTGTLSKPSVRAKFRSPFASNIRNTMESRAPSTSETRASYNNQSILYGKRKRERNFKNDDEFDFGRNPTSDWEYVSNLSTRTRKFSIEVCWSIKNALIKPLPSVYHS